MQTSEFYYGLPQGQWDILLAKAEDLLREEDIGAHLVGLYPAGNRIYGMESESPGILCLYVDTVESLINPTFVSGNPTGFRTIPYGTSSSPIIFANLFNWVQHIISGKCSWVNKEWLHALPFAGDLIYQDNSIDEVLERLRDHLYNQRFFMPVGCKQMSYPHDILFHRADAILATTGKFHPCINPAWGRVCTLETIQAPDEIADTDAQFRNGLLNRGAGPGTERCRQLLEWLRNKADHARCGVAWDRKLTKKIGEEVASLYRFTL